MPVDGGIKARSRRGQIGETWWSQRFVSVLESFNLGARLQRGRRYARAGQVLSLDVASGLVTAAVQGSRAKPYRVLIGVEQLAPAEWDRVEDAMAAKAVFLARLLAGDMPDEIEEAFAACSLSLFPASRGDLDTACSCPDWANPCKHVAATYYLLAEAFDTDPFLIFAWRGRPRDELLDHLRARRAPVGVAPGGSAGAGAGAGAAGGSAGGDDVWSAVDALAGGAPPNDPVLETWWSAGPELAGVQVRPRVAAVPDILLRQADPLSITVRGADLVEWLRGAYPGLASAAAARAVGDADQAPRGSGRPV
ncbi:MAG: SWIM zinc finger family protein [Acidimicrobiales bacterium]